ncbi:MAG: translation initiation factor IF-2 [Chloroflexi bacterium]|nr:translation initiation factor IF-2 [Chloroflexota bacterium]
MPPRRGYRSRPGRPSPARRNGRASAEAAAPVATAVPPVERDIVIPLALTVRELAERLSTTPIDIVKELLKNSIVANINQTIDYDTAAVVATDLGFNVVEAPIVEVSPQELRGRRYREEEAAHLRERPPVVTVMGHVDHGKTSLLDVIRQTNVTEREAGGITQHIGAYQVEVDQHRITFLDTPGHEAFTAMRARGAMATDIAVIVVAADDGVQPQTVEAIDHARAAGVPIMIAINKIDKPEADPERIKRQLAEQNLLIEEWGGETICVPVSAKTGQGIQDILEQILLVAEIEELKANPNRRAEGVVVEAQLDQQRGPMATLLVHNGTLRLGEVLVAGDTSGRIKAMYDEHNHQIKRADPSSPAKVLGLGTVPQAGDTFSVVADERTARNMIQDRLRERQLQESHVVRPVTLQDLFAQAQSGQVQELNVVLKTDVQGSIDPIRSSLLKLGDETLRVKVLHAAPGSITESDVMLALASRGIVLGFNSRPEPGARRLADMEGVELRAYDVIYTLVEDVEKALKGMLAPTFVDVVEGHAEVRQVFRLGRRGAIAGCAVTEGRVARAAQVRVLRQGKVVADDKVSGLKHFKDDVREMPAGSECGVSLEGFADFQEGDVLEFYRKERAS